MTAMFRVTAGEGAACYRASVIRNARGGLLGGLPIRRLGVGPAHTFGVVDLLRVIVTGKQLSTLQLH